jgi:hypothetical protein
MSKDDDIVSDLLLRVRVYATGLTDSEFLRLQFEARQVWGGMRPYVRKWAPDDARLPALGSTLSTGGTVKDAFAAAGVGKTKGYGLLGRRWPR